MASPEYKHPVTIQIVSTKSKMYYLSAKDCVYANEVIYCLESKKYYKGFQSSSDPCQYYFREVDRINDIPCDLCGDRDDFEHRIDLQKITVNKPRNLIDKTSLDFIHLYNNLNMPTIEKWVCSSCREAIQNAGRS